MPVPRETVPHNESCDPGKAFEESDGHVSPGVQTTLRAPLSILTKGVFGAPTCCGRLMRPPSLDYPAEGLETCLPAGNGTPTGPLLDLRWLQRSGGQLLHRPEK